MAADEETVPSSPPELADRTQSRWSDAACPLPRPSRLLGKMRSTFDACYADQLDGCAAAFDACFVGSAEERAATEARLRGSLPWVAGYDAWRDAITSLTDSSVSSGIFLAPWLAATAATSFIVSDASIATQIGESFAGLFVGFALLIAVVPIVDLLSDSGAIVAVALLVAACPVATAFLLAEQPTGFVTFVSGVVGFATFWIYVLVTSGADLVSTAVLRRRKVLSALHAEICDTLLVALSIIRQSEPDMNVVTSHLLYVADLTEHHGKRLILAADQGGLSGARARNALKGIAAGMRELALVAAFPDRNLESRLTTPLSRQMSAFALMHFGDLVVGDVPEVTLPSRIERLLRSVRNVVSAVAPLALLLVIPRVLDLRLSDQLFGTLLTVSLAWLALYVVAWLDPRALTRLSSLQGVAGLLGGGKRGGD